MTSCFPAVPWVRLHQRPLQLFLLRNWDGSTSSLETRVRIPSRIKGSLWWWRSPPQLKRSLEWFIPISQRIATDASSLGFGSPSKPRSGTGNMVPQGSKGFIESKRASGGTGSLRSILEGGQGSQSADSIRHHYYCGIPQQARRYKKSDPSIYSPEDLVMGSRESLLDHSSTPKGDAKLSGRLPQPLPGVLRQSVPSTWRFLWNLLTDGDHPK